MSLLVLGRLDVCQGGGSGGLRRPVWALGDEGNGKGRVRMYAYPMVLQQTSTSVLEIHIYAL